jgi:hypothetical protein
MSYYQTRPIRDHIQRITVEEAEQFIPLKEDYTGLTVDRCPYYTMIDGHDEWSLITYFTGRKRNKYVNRTVDSRITGNREFFDVSLDEAKKVITQFGQNYL